MTATESAPLRGRSLWPRLGLHLWGLLPLLWVAAPLATQAAGGSPTLQLLVPSELHVGEHARFVIEVSLPPSAGQPLLLTPFREGQALEVVKGRLLRSDARDAQASPLQFELPVLARAPGSALIGVRLLAYLCEPVFARAKTGGPRRCRAVEVETRANVMVLP